jgi:arginyl-tRNA synthetase
MQEKLRVFTVQALRDLYQIDISAAEILVNRTPKEFSGDYSIVVFSFVKKVKKSPEQLANELGEYFKNNFQGVENFNVVKGYLNLTFSGDFWINYFSEISSDKNFATFNGNTDSVLVEYCGPNTNKPLHLGHLRNIFVGYSVAEILKATGHRVVKANIINDRGVHICKSMLAYEKYGEGETPESSGMKGDHLVGKYYVRFDQELKKQIQELVTSGKSEDEAKKEAPLQMEIQKMLLQWENGDEKVRALWSKMNSWVYDGFQKTFDEIGNDFDKNYYESNTYLLGKEIVEEGLKQNIFFKKDDGSVWVDLTSDGLDQKLLLRGDGTSVYMTQDLGTTEMKYEDFHCNRNVFVVADEQNHHFKVLKAIFKKMNTPFADGLFHLAYGMVDLPSGKMKSREGTVVDADELISEMETTAESHTRSLGKTENFSSEELKNLFHTIGMGALKFFILKVDPKKRMIFNPEESVDFHGATGPFIQYAHARIHSLIRKFYEREKNTSFEKTFSYNELNEPERNLILQFLDFPVTLWEAAETFSPALLANYLYSLAKVYNQFYGEISILNSENQDAKIFRIRLSEFTARIIQRGMKLLGIDVPDRM